MDTKSCFNLIKKANGKTKNGIYFMFFKHGTINEAKSTESLIVSVAALCLSFPGNPASNLEKKLVRAPCFVQRSLSWLLLV